MPDGIAMYEVDFKESPGEKTPSMRCRFTFKDADGRFFAGFGKDWKSAKQDALDKRARHIKTK
jgi:hypothetical protein